MNRGVLKRLIKETNDLKKNELIKFVNFDHEFLDNYGQTKPSIEVKLDNMNIKFIMSYDYPFKVPSLFINEKPYYNYLKISNVENLQNLKKEFNYKCLCCETISCPHNWSPARRLTEFIDEIQKFRKIKIHLESKRIGPIMLNIINKYKFFIFYL